MREIARRWQREDDRSTLLERVFAELLRELRHHTNPANHRPFYIAPIDHPLQRAAVFALGMLALLLAGVGALAPVMPVSPFAFVALFCFARSSARVRRWITQSHVMKSAVSFIWSRAEPPFIWVRWCAVRFGGLRLVA
jgi:hypothetical protein